jgi:phosphatidylglycerophosphate synthase
MKEAPVPDHVSGRRDLVFEAFVCAAALAACLASALYAAFGAGLPFAASLSLFAIVAIVALVGLAQHPYPWFGLANAVTLTRAALLAAVLGLAVAAVQSRADSVALPVLAVLALALDGVDGWAARRFGTASAFGARFDLETDALTVLVLSGVLAASDRVGPWVLGLGLMRYGFIIAGWIWPSLAQSLPPRFLRKAICVFVVSSLAIALMPVPEFLAGSLCAAALGALIYSFGSDCVFLLRAARPPAGSRAEASAI